MDWEPSRVNRARESKGRLRRPPPDCYRCGELGHIAKYCRNATQVKKARSAPSNVGREPQEEADQAPGSESEKE
jgi:hypothetical protein